MVADTYSVPNVFLADGGHADNSAILALLRRQCRTILAVDCSKTRKMTMLRNLIPLGRAKLDCHFLPNGAYSMNTYLAMFELPRARFVENETGGEEGRTLKLRRCMNFLQEAGSKGAMETMFQHRRHAYFQQLRRSSLNPLYDTTVHEMSQECPSNELSEVLWADLPHSMRQLIASIQEFPDGHIYCLFHDEAALQKSFHDFPELRGPSGSPDATMPGLRVCHALDDASAFTDEDFLPEAQQEACLRNVLHIKVKHQTGDLGDLLILRGENTHCNLRAIRERLAPYEKLIQEGGRKIYPPLGVVPQGRFPSHKTGTGEGYEWPHIREYAEYARRSASCAWDIILPKHPEDAACTNKTSRESHKESASADISLAQSEVDRTSLAAIGRQGRTERHEGRGEAQGLNAGPVSYMAQPNLVLDVQKAAIVPTARSSSGAVMGV